MASFTSHKIYRDPTAPWWELRASTDSNDCYRQHTHDEYSLGIVDAGSSTFRHPAGIASIGIGTVVMIEPRIIHSCNPAPAQAWTYRMLFVRADWLHDVMARHWCLREPVRSLEFLSRSMEVGEVTAAVGQLLRFSDDTSTRLAAELPKLLSEWSRPACSRANGKTMPAELAPAELLLQSESGTTLSVGSLAEACNMTATRFIREFRKHHGMTPGDYLQNERINGARRLIGRGISISQAAFEMGFSDQAHLQRAFKSRHAMTPGIYKK